MIGEKKKDAQASKPAIGEKAKKSAIGEKTSAVPLAKKEKQKK